MRSSTIALPCNLTSFSQHFFAFSLFFLFNGWDLKFYFYNFKFQSFIAIALCVIISIPKINYLCDFKEVWGTIVIIYLLWSFFLFVRNFFFLEKLVRKFWFWVWVFLYSIFFFFFFWGSKVGCIHMSQQPNLFTLKPRLKFNQTQAEPTTKIYPHTQTHFTSLSLDSSVSLQRPRRSG